MYLKIRAGAGLGHGNGGDALAGDHGRDELFNLFRSSKL